MNTARIPGLPQTDELNMNQDEEPGTEVDKPGHSVSKSSQANARPPIIQPRLRPSRVAKLKAIIIIFVLVDLLAAFAISAFLLVVYIRTTKLKMPVSLPYYFGVISSLMASWIPSGIIVLFKTLEKRRLLRISLILHILVTLATCIFMGFIKGDLRALSVLIPLLVLRIVIWIFIVLVLMDKNQNKVIPHPIVVQDRYHRSSLLDKLESKPPYAPSHPRIDQEHLHQEHL